MPLSKLASVPPELVAEIGRHLDLKDRVNCLNASVALDAIMHFFEYANVILTDSNISFQTTRIDKIVSVIRRRKPCLQILAFQCINLGKEHVQELEDLEGDLMSSFSLDGIKECKLILEMKDTACLRPLVNKLPMELFTRIEVYQANTTDNTFSLDGLKDVGVAPTLLSLQHNGLHVLSDKNATRGLESLKINCHGSTLRPIVLDLSNVPDGCFVEIWAPHMDVCVVDAQKVTHIQFGILSSPHHRVYQSFADSRKRSNKPLMLKSLSFMMDIDCVLQHHPMFRLVELCMECTEQRKLSVEVLVYNCHVINPAVIPYLKGLLSRLKGCGTLTIKYTSKSTLVLAELARRMIDPTIILKKATFLDPGLNYVPTDDILARLKNTERIEGLLDLWEPKEAAAWWWVGKLQ